ncbi:hypothetical protein L228DRAFT_238361 [Xylona heveae TC161]|uniref:Uncharacterized protein n=1 Tax=Xylona heveae (strain CBS 132557 / TC161) TaxID=1328760 RepID=A0A165HQU4_XYLHT|nr:hypothetical protein L228DRAFT_238361 [Xylona heveae TC161]KZF23846.1 hypothetical protein L228DRAFT_238361 [Xylona heveae TC161]
MALTHKLKNTKQQVKHAVEVGNIPSVDNLHDIIHYCWENNKHEDNDYIHIINDDTAREALHGLIVKHFNKTNTDKGGEHDNDKPPMVGGFKAQLFKQGGQAVHGVPTVEIKDPIAGFYTRDLVEK